MAKVYHPSLVCQEKFEENMKVERYFLLTFIANLFSKIN